MIISETWLREWVNPDLSTEALAHELTMAGLEVDGITRVAEPFSGVIVAEIVAAEQHPDADKLRVCEVATGEGTVQIVCGAPNARVGLKAPLAQVGAVLPGNFKIKKAKLRGVESQGMLCAESELTLSEESDGLMELPADAPVGKDLRDYLALDDAIIEIGLTPNRADCLGMLGVARDVAVITDSKLCEAEIAPVAASHDTQFPVDVQASDKCPRYIGRVITDVDLTRPTPTTIVERLRRAGIRSIDAVVDVTNYVMLELGQPLHAFDLATLNGGIIVREAHAGEQMVLLDGSEITLSEGTLVIADHERALALAGIMGGENSGVSAETTAIFLESAFFAPTLMAGRARSYGLHTDASHRYERGVDPLLQRKAIERATQLLLDIVGGQAGPCTEVAAEASLPVAEPITLRADRISRVLGFSMESSLVESILEGLGFTLTETNPGEWTCTAPSWRFDMGQEVDLIEELARIYGYNRLPVSRIRADLSMTPQREDARAAGNIRRQLVARGFHEAITFSFISPKQQAVFDPELEPVTLRNPISAELAVMRTGLAPGLLGVLAHNTKRQNARVRVFEMGMRFLPGDTLQQESMLALAMTGTRSGEGWANGSDKLDFFDLKGEVEQVLAGSGVAVTFERTVRPGFHDGQTAEVLLDGTIVGIMGTVHPLVCNDLDLPANTFVAELELAAVMAARLPAFQDVSRFPEVRRDIAVLLQQDVSAQAVTDVIKAAAGDLLDDLTIFDVYQGKGIDPQQKSLAMGLTFRDSSRTLDDSEISGLMSQVIDSLKENLNAQLRS